MINFPPYTIIKPYTFIRQVRVLASSCHIFFLHLHYGLEGCHKTNWVIICTVQIGIYLEQDQNRLLQDREQDHFSIDLQDHKSISVEWLGRKISDARCWECIEKQYAF